MTICQQRDWQDGDWESRLVRPAGLEPATCGFEATRGRCRRPRTLRESRRRPGHERATRGHLTSTLQPIRNRANYVARLFRLTLCLSSNPLRPPPVAWLLWCAPRGGHLRVSPPTPPASHSEATNGLLDRFLRPRIAATEPNTEAHGLRMGNLGSMDLWNGITPS